jgi:hypothetical protein
MAAIGSGTVKESRSRSPDTANVPANPTRVMDPRPNRPACFVDRNAADVCHRPQCRALHLQREGI